MRITHAFLNTCFSLLLLTLLSSTAVFSATPIALQNEDITPPQVFLHISRVQAELELLRHHMGKPKFNKEHLTFKVHDAAPREVFYQALTLFKKTGQLSFEHLRVHTGKPTTPINNIKPADVFDLADNVLKQIRTIKAHIGIQKKIKEPTLDKQKTPTHVLLATMQANRQINVLLDQKFAPKDVFKKVSLAIGYSAKLLASFPSAIRIPKPEVLQTGKQPADVFHRLVKSYNLIHNIAARSKITTLQLEVQNSLHKIAPSDVYDIASLIVSDLAYINTKLPKYTFPRPVFDPGRKYPSDVYQRVSILEKQIKALDTFSTKNPLWLTKALH